MRYCIALGCKSTSRKRKTEKTELKNTMNVTFHAFPTDPAKRKKWLKIMKLENKILHRGSCLCSLHFKEEFMDLTSSLIVRLRDDAIPHFKNTQRTEIIDETVLTPVDNIDIKTELIDIGQQFSSDTYSTCDKETNTPPFSLLQETPRMIEKGTRVSPERIWNCTAVESIQMANLVIARNLKKKIKVLERKVRERDKKILTIKSILNELKVAYISDQD